MSNQSYNFDEAKRLDIVDYLSKIGFEPAKVRGNDYWYNSPLRNEKSPSFKVNRKLNLWYDHGIGKGGSIIDFGIMYFNYSALDFVNRLANDSFTFRRHSPDIMHVDSSNDSPIKVLQVGPITSISLKNYLEARRIPLSLANGNCTQVHYSLYGKNHIAIGFKNNSGGFELRNQHFKGSTSPKDVSLIDNGGPGIAVVEGFFDYLSLLVIRQSQQHPPTNYLVLNSLAFFEKSRPIMEKHTSIGLFLDTDKAGLECTTKALALGNLYIDKSSLYAGAKDINEWLQGQKRIPNVKKLKRPLR